MKSDWQDVFLHGTADGSSFDRLLFLVPGDARRGFYGARSRSRLGRFRPLHRPQHHSGRPSRLPPPGRPCSSLRVWVCNQLWNGSGKPDGNDTRASAVDWFSSKRILATRSRSLRLLFEKIAIMFTGTNHGRGDLAWLCSLVYDWTKRTNRPPLELRFTWHGKRKEQFAQLSGGVRRRTISSITAVSRRDRSSFVPFPVGWATVPDGHNVIWSIDDIQYRPASKHHNQATSHPQISTLAISVVHDSLMNNTGTQKRNTIETKLLKSGFEEIVTSQYGSQLWTRSCGWIAKSLMESAV